MEIVSIGEGDALRVLSAGSTQASLISAAREFNAATGRAFAFSFDTAGGVEKRAAVDRADVIASSMDSLYSVACAGGVDGQPRCIGSARIAMGVRLGEQVPDIKTMDAFRSTVRNARSISRGDPTGGGTAGKHLVEVFAQLGLMEEVQAKSVLRVGGANVMAAVAEGLADLGFTQSTEIAPVEGVMIGGWLPPEIQLTTTYGVAVGACAAKPHEARAFVEWLTTPQGARHFTQAGFFPA